MFAGFIGETQTILPRKNFARFLLMAFLMYSLVIRALYQGAYFELVNSRQNRGEIKSIAEMIENDFTFYVPGPVAESFQGTQAIKKRLEIRFRNLHFSMLCDFRTKIISNQETNDYSRKIRKDSSFKGALGSWLMISLFENMHRSEASQQIICRETVMTIPLIIYTRKDFFLLKSINQKIEIFKAAGLIAHWQFQDVNKAMVRKGKSNFKEPKTLTVNDFVGSFRILFVGCCASFAGLVVEICVHRVNKKFRD